MTRTSNHHPIIDWVVGAILLGLLCFVVFSAVRGVTMRIGPPLILIP